MKYYILLLLVYPYITFAQDFLEFKKPIYETEIKNVNKVNLEIIEKNNLKLNNYSTIIIPIYSFESDSVSQLKVQELLGLKLIGYHTYYYKRNELKCTITFYTNQESKAIISKDKKDELGNFIISKREKFFFTIEGFSPGIIFYVEGNEIIYAYYLPLKYGNTSNILDLRYDDFLKLQTIDELIKSIYFYKCLRMGGSIDSCY